MPTILSSPIRFRYEEAYRKWYDRGHPAAVKDHGYPKCKYPDTRKANGLTQFVLNFLKWNGWRATRISSAGSYRNGKFTFSQTRRGTADISATIKGMAVMIEIKVGKDKPSPYQLREQELERKAGGIYEFIRDPEQFIIWYDALLKTIIE